MNRACAAVVCMLLALMALPVQAQTRAWLDRTDISYGESVALTIETDQPASSIDSSPLRDAFDIAGQTQQSSVEWVNGRSSRKTLLVLGLRPKAPGVLTIPALRVGSGQTAPLRLVVRPPQVQPASARSDVFVETLIDDPKPYVQQSVGVTVRLNYAIPLLSGQLDQDPPAHASMQQVGEDQRSTRELDGHHYYVIERHYLLIPESSGTLQLPGARFNGLRGSDSLNALFDDDQHPVSAASAPIQLQVRPIPPGAPQPWLPLRALDVRYLRVPTRARVGEAATVEIEMTADGASDAQLPALQLPSVSGVRVFAEPPQADTQLTDGHLRASVRRSFSLVPQQAGALTIPGPTVTWWDALAGVARTARLPAITLDVAPGFGEATPAIAPRPPLRPEPVQPGAMQTSSRNDFDWAWLAGGVGGLVVVLLGGWWRRRRAAKSAGKTDSAQSPRMESLDAALASDDLARIARALTQQAGVAEGDLYAVHARLDDPQQRDAIGQLQAARWGSGDAQLAVRSLRAAFAGRVRWRHPKASAEALLPPLYPE